MEKSKLEVTNGKILDAKDIAALLEMDDSNVRRLISSLVKKGVLGKTHDRL